MATRSTYRLRGGVPGRERLRVLSRVMEAMTPALLERTGVGPGDRCLDVGCGGGDVTLALARRVSPGGTAVGVDIDAVKLGIARDEAAAAGVGNVEYRVAGVDALPEAGFDLVYARFLLTHLPDAAAALEHMAGAARPGGVVAVEDIDYNGGFCHPPCAAYDAFWELYPRVAAGAGGDARIGRRLPGLFADAGLREIGVHIEQPAGFAADTKLLSALTAENIADAAVEAGLAPDGEVRALVAELHAFAARPDTLLSLPRMVQVWARTPS
jgi:SAM-dependent methyltransferase